MKSNQIKKKRAIILRKTGKSYREIEKILNVRRSTLSGWLKNIILSENQRQKLHKKWLKALVKARSMASEVHRNGRLNRIKKVRDDVEIFSSNIRIDDQLGEIIFATFYQAEGVKKENAVVFANSNPFILKSIYLLFEKTYKIDKSKLRCCLHLRSDQSEIAMKKYWSKLLNIPQPQFNKTQFDKRVIKPTYSTYKGVCVIIYLDMNLQRRILYLGEKLLSIMGS